MQLLCARFHLPRGGFGVTIRRQYPPLGIDNYPLSRVNIWRGRAVVLQKHEGQMAEIRQTLSRGIQEDDVWAAADVLLHEAQEGFGRST